VELVCERIADDEQWIRKLRLLHFYCSTTKNNDHCRCRIFHDAWCIHSVTHLYTYYAYTFLFSPRKNNLCHHILITRTRPDSARRPTSANSTCRLCDESAIYFGSHEYYWIQQRFRVRDALWRLVTNLIFEYTQMVSREIGCVILFFVAVIALVIYKPFFFLHVKMHF